MNIDVLPEIEERSMLPPIKLTTQQEDLCRRLGSLNQRTIQGQDLSKMFKGAIFATREESRSNPDWMAQSAHSLREILYQFQSKWMDAFRSYGSATTEEEKFQETLGKLYGRITSVAHHQLDLSSEEYEILIDDYQRVLLWALARQVDVHDQIDKFLSGNKPGKIGK